MWTRHSVHDTADPLHRSKTAIQNEPGSLSVAMAYANDVSRRARGIAEETPPGRMQSGRLFARRRSRCYTRSQLLHANHDTERGTVRTLQLNRAKEGKTPDRATLKS